MLDFFHFIIPCFQSNFISISSAVFGIIGAVIFIGSIIPPFLETLRSKKTYAIAGEFFIFCVLAALAFFIVAILIIFNNSSNVSLKLLGSAMIVSNTFSFGMNLYMLKIKLENMKAAKEKGISEMDYYNSFIARKSFQSSEDIQTDNKLN